MDVSAPLGRRLDLFDNVIPAGASATVDVLVTCGALTGRTDLLDEARKQLAAQAGLLDRAGLEMAGWLDAALRLQGPLHDVVVAGDPDAATTVELYQAAASRLSPGVVVTPLPRDGAPLQLLDLAPALGGKTATDGTAVAYVCLQGICKAPTHDPVSVRGLVEDIWDR